MPLSAAAAAAPILPISLKRSALTLAALAFPPCDARCRRTARTSDRFGFMRSVYACPEDVSREIDAPRCPGYDDPGAVKGRTRPRLTGPCG